MITIGFLILMLGMPFTSGPAAAAPTIIQGNPEVLSGDTLSIAGIVLHLSGIDAPEEGQLCRVPSGRAFDCGLVSKTALQDLTVAVSVSCRLTGGRRENLPEARCFAAGYDLSKGMVHTGWALAWPKTGSTYSAVEITARKARHGMWRGEFIAPWDWRGGSRLAEERQQN
jgi:endonuclease YncB( thermonuclease family)